MSSPEIPEDRYLPVPVKKVSSLAIPDFVFESVLRDRVQVMEDLVPAIGRVASVSGVPWPRSLHTFFGEGGNKILLRTKDVKIRGAGLCLNVTVNVSLSEGARNEQFLEIHDYAYAPKSDGSVVYTRSKIAKKLNNATAWDISPTTGPVLYPKHDCVPEVSGEDYKLPAFGSLVLHEQSYADVIDITTATESLLTWLHLPSESTYEEYQSNGI